MTHPVDLSLANEHLQWNPYPLDREARQEVLWNRRSESPPQPLEREQLLRLTKYRAEVCARLLASHHEGRLILVAEDHGPNRLDPQYWCARASFYEAEYDRLHEEDYNRASRSVTPAYYHPESLDETELDCAKRHARSAAENLARYPAGKALLDAEDNGESATDPEYWWRKQKEYKAAYAAIRKEGALERAKRHAYTNRKKLATFPAGRALLQAEDHGASAADPEYWRKKEKYYWDEHERLRKEFWDYWKPICFDTWPPSEASNLSTTPSEASVASSLTIRACRTSMTKGSLTTKRTTRTTQHGKETRGTQVAVASNTGSCSGTDKMKRTHSTRRRKSKDAYRRRAKRVVKATQVMLSSECPHQSPPNRLATPKSGESRIHRPTVERPVSYLQSQNAYVTPTSPESSMARVRTAHRQKGRTRRKCPSDKDRSYHGSRLTSQPVNPVSSRLRSNNHRLHQ